MKPDKEGRLYYPVFNKSGKAAFFLDQDKVHFYSWEGKPAGFVEKSAVFTFKGKHLGWLDEGWLRDKVGKCVGFTEPGKGGPNPPRTKSPQAPPADKKEPPPHPKLKDPPERPPRKAVWSSLTDKDFFKGK